MMCRLFSTTMNAGVSWNWNFGLHCLCTKCLGKTLPNAFQLEMCVTPCMHAFTVLLPEPGAAQYTEITAVGLGHSLIAFTFWSLTRRSSPEFLIIIFSRCIRLNLWSSAVPGAKTVKLFIARLLLMHVNHGFTMPTLLVLRSLTSHLFAADLYYVANL